MVFHIFAAGCGGNFVGLPPEAVEDATSQTFGTWMLFFFGVSQTCTPEIYQNPTVYHWAFLYQLSPQSNFFDVISYIESTNLARGFNVTCGVCSIRCSMGNQITNKLDETQWAKLWTGTVKEFGIKFGPQNEEVWAIPTNTNCEITQPIFWHSNWFFRLLPRQLTHLINWPVSSRPCHRRMPGPALHRVALGGRLYRTQLWHTHVYHTHTHSCVTQNFCML